MTSIIVVNSCLAQNRNQLTFSAEFKSGNANYILLEVKNLSSKTYYYYIGVEGLVDTGYIAILSDIKSIGQKGFLKLVPIKPHSKFVKSISKKSIIKECYCHSISKLRFYIAYFPENNFDAHSEVIKAAPLLIEK